MRYLYTLDELLTIQTNGWSCTNCGAAWLDLDTPSMSIPVTAGADPNCQHPKLSRARLARPAA